MGMIQNDWLEEISDEFRKPYYAQLFQFVKKEYSTYVVYPPAEDIFNAFHFTPLSKVKVVILGQDPYQCESGTWAQFFRKTGSKGDSAVIGEYISGAA